MLRELSSKGKLEAKALARVLVCLCLRCKVSGTPGWPQTHSVAEDDHEVIILLLPSPKYWRHTAVHQPHSVMPSCSALVLSQAGYLLIAPFNSWESPLPPCGAHVSGD